MSKRKYPIVKKCIRWSTEDFIARALQLEGENWEDVYDESCFALALITMINNHDAGEGITWYTIESYLNGMCLKPKK